MTANERINCYLPSSAAAVCERLARERGLTKSGVLRQALGILQAVHEAERGGRHIGIASDRAALDTVLIVAL